MVNKWENPINIMRVDDWLKIGKDIWGMIFKLCIRENIEEYNKYIVVIIRCTCKKFSQILTPQLCLQSIYDDPKANISKHICYMMKVYNHWTCSVLNHYKYNYASVQDIDKENIFHKFLLSEYFSESGCILIKMKNKYRRRKDYFLRLKLKWCSDNGTNEIYRAPGEHLVWKQEYYFRKHKLMYGLRENFIEPYLTNWY